MSKNKVVTGKEMIEKLRSIIQLPNNVISVTVDADMDDVCRVTTTHIAEYALPKTELAVVKDDK